MFKKFLLIFSFVSTIILFSACNKPKTIILFNNFPITKSNFLDNANQFDAERKIYYLFITEKPLESEFIRVRILKREGKEGISPPVEVVYSNDFKIRKDEVYYYNDYIIMHSPGDYTMLIYSINKLNRPLAIADFRVK